MSLGLWTVVQLILVEEKKLSHISDSLQVRLN